MINQVASEPSLESQTAQHEVVLEKNSLVSMNKVTSSPKDKFK